MKRLLIILLVFSLLIPLTACNDAATSETGESDTTTTSDSVSETASSEEPTEATDISPETPPESSEITEVTEESFEEPATSEEATIAPTESLEEPADSSEAPADPSVEPTESSETPTDPSVEPTESSETPTQPSEEPTESTEEPEETEPLEPACQHEFAAATCKVPQTCILCGETQGEKLEHEFTAAGCTYRGQCIHCGKKTGRALGHEYNQTTGLCIRCEKQDPFTVKKEGVTRIAFVGDSITAGKYFLNISTYLGTGFEYNGFGVSGTTGYAAGRDGSPPVPKAYIDQPEYARSLYYNPDAVVIMLGTNDSKSMNTEGVNGIRADSGEQYKKDMIALVQSYQSLSDSPTVFLALPPTSFRPENGGISNVNIETLIIPLLQSVAEETGAIVIDTHTATKNASEGFPDGVHPNDDGKALLSQTVAEVILAWKNPTTDTDPEDPESTSDTDTEPENPEDTEPDTETTSDTNTDA